MLCFYGRDSLYYTTVIMKQCYCLFPGFVGLFSALFLWPGFFILHYSHYETFQWPDGRQWMFIVINGVIGTVLSEFLWLW